MRVKGNNFHPGHPESPPGTVEGRAFKSINLLDATAESAIGIETMTDSVLFEPRFILLYRTVPAVIIPDKKMARPANFLPTIKEV